MAIIENEFGETGIDGDLIVGFENDLFELNNGCICCSLNEDFYKLLDSLLAKQEQYDEIVIETTGIADPAIVSSPFLINKSVSKFFELKRVICLVDARHIEKELKETVEARKQISFSDILLITKTDLVTSADIKRIENLLDELNPFAAVFIGYKGNYPFKELFDLDRMKIAQRRPKFTLVTSAVKTQVHHDLTSLSFTFSNAFLLQALQLRLNQFLVFQAKDVYRIKGILWAEGVDTRVIIQSVSTDLAISFGDKWAAGEIKQSRIVFIGSNLNPSGFEKMLKQCLAKIKS